MSDSKTQETPRNEATLMPPVDVIEDASGITLLADLPGVPKDKLNLYLSKDNLDRFVLLVEINLCRQTLANESERHHGGSLFKVWRNRKRNDLPVYKSFLAVN